MRKVSMNSKFVYLNETVPNFHMTSSCFFIRCCNTEIPPLHLRISAAYRAASVKGVRCLSFKVCTRICSDNSHACTEQKESYEADLEQRSSVGAILAEIPCPRRSRANLLLPSWRRYNGQRERGNKKNAQRGPGGASGREGCRQKTYTEGGKITDHCTSPAINDSLVQCCVAYAILPEQIKFIRIRYDE